MKQPLLALLALALTLPACGSVGPDPEPGADAGDEPGDHRADGAPDPDTDANPGDDGDPPTVLSVDPADGEGGVRSGADITIVFNRPMDAASVAAAWSSALLPADAVTFSWNGAGDTLTVDPDDPLPVAEGSGEDPDATPATQIAFAIGTGAAAADGVHLAAGFDSAFTTVRRLELEIPADGALTDSRVSNNSSAPGASDVEYAGDTSGDLQVKLLVSFALPELPGGASLERAVLSAQQVSSSSNIFNLLGGGLEAMHVRFVQLTSAFGAGSLGSAGVLSSTSGSGARSLAVTSAVADDLDDGVSHSQFRLEFPLATDGDGAYDTLQLERDSLRLTVTYLIE
jgi:hypothetical protein